MKIAWKRTLIRLSFILLFGIGMSTLCLAGITEVRGVIGPGAHYVFFVPDGMDGDDWNGEVVYYAHGYTLPGSPIIPPPDLNEESMEFLNRGYAFAASSYSASGWSVEEAIRQMHQLRGLFASQFGMPTRSYITGHSMGGNITVALAEKFGLQYDGAMPMCGAVAGPEVAWGYMLNARVVFDFYYPGVIPGDVFNLPEGVTIGDVLNLYYGAVLTDPTGVLAMANIEQLAISYVNIFELIDTIAWRILFQLFVLGDIDRTHGRVFFDNMDTYYTGSPDDVALNDGIERIASTPDVKNYLRHNYEPTGKLKIPVLTLHNTRDPIVPIENEDVFEDAVKAAGCENYLVRKHVETSGHCIFDPEEIGAAFDELVSWVEGGPKPADGELIVP